MVISHAKKVSREAKGNAVFDTHAVIAQNLYSY